MSGDPRQYSREFSLRRRDAEQLRDQLARQGLDTRELDEAIAEMRRLERREFKDPLGLAQLQAQVVESLKDFEFSLYRQLGLLNEGRAAVGARPPVPPEYRAMVEEYYRALAAERKR